MLAEIMSEEEDLEAVRVILKTSSPSNCRRTYYIGLTGTMGKWWWDTSMKNATYLNFGGFVYVTGVTHCVTITHTLKWILVQCLVQACVLCQNGKVKIRFNGADLMPLVILFKTIC